MKEIAITENHLYQKAYKLGTRAVCGNVAVYVLRDYTAKKQMKMNPQKQYINRIGISVSKKLGGAVERNRAKRIIRAGFAQAKAYAKMKTGYLIVIAARHGCVSSDSNRIRDELIWAFKRLDMYSGGEVLPKSGNEKV